jgi:hypothetical protein
MSMWKNCPKCSPTSITLTMEKVAQKYVRMLYFWYFQKAVQRKLSPNGRIFSQSGDSGPEAARKRLRSFRECRFNFFDRFDYSTILLFYYSTIQLFNYSTILLFNYFTCATVLAFGEILNDRKRYT